MYIKYILKYTLNNVKMYIKVNENKHIHQNVQYESYK